MLLMPDKNCDWSPARSASPEWVAARISVIARDKEGVRRHQLNISSLRPLYIAPRHPTVFLIARKRTNIPLEPTSISPQLTPTVVLFSIQEPRGCIDGRNWMGRVRVLVLALTEGAAGRRELQRGKVRQHRGQVLPPPSSLSAILPSSNHRPSFTPPLLSESSQLPHVFTNPLDAGCT